MKAVMMNMTSTTLPAAARYTLITTVVLSSVALSGCAASSDKYPSLTLRDFEKTPAVAAAPSPVPNANTPIPAAMSSDAIRQLAAERDSARSAHAAFMSALPIAQRKSFAARGTGPTTNIWADAQLAIAELTVHRSRTAAALANIDELIAQASIAQRGLPAQITYQTEVAEMVARQDRAISGLGAGL